MTGWVKLWRKLKYNGHLKMPGNALKLWIYCLLEAAPYPDRARGLKAGELWLNYEQVRQVIGTNSRQMSKSTVSGALKYLEKNGYLTLQVKQFYGVKACVANWQKYQSGTETVPEHGPSSTEIVPEDELSSTETVPDLNLASTETVPGSSSAGTETVPEHGPSGTEIVPGDEPAGTKTVPDRALASTITVPVPVLVRAPQPYSSAASEAPKNIKNKELNNKDPAAVALLHEFEKEFGRPLSPLEVNQLADWQKDFSLDLIKESLARAALKNKRSLAYIGGILTNWRQAGISTVEAARQEKLRHSRQTGGKVLPGGRQDPAGKRKEFIKSLYL
ncbi:MAG: DnaD domain protein [Desulfotomaculaceae bacterium]|nr:DnaD domain protein [Desulfotomaculaceae bacterium]